MTPEDSTPTAETQPQAQPLAPGASRITIQADLAPGTRVDIHIEAHAADGTPLEVHTFSLTRPSDGAPQVVEARVLPADEQALEQPASSVLPPAQPAAPSNESLLDWVTGMFKRPTAQRAPVRLPSTQPVRAWLGRLESTRWQSLPWEVILFTSALLIYFLTRVIGLTHFPIYFFTDEAVQTVLAQDFIRDGLQGYDRVWLPTFFQNVYQYNLGVSVYLQVLPYLAFGKSVFVTRLIPMLVTLAGAAALGLTLKRSFNSRMAWVGVLLLSITPAWFLHSRTAFETAIATAFYAGFLYFYLEYRRGKLRSLYWAVGMAALVFYSYSPAQMVIGVTALFFLLGDLRYHWQQRNVVLRALGLTLLLALPFARFLIQHPEANQEHLTQLYSYWIQNLTLTEKLGRYLREYLYGLSPVYWFIPNDHDLARHLMKGYGHMLLGTSPFLLLGLVIAVRNFRKPEYRTLLLAALAAPSGAALVAVSITRIMIMVVPATLLTAIGLAAVVEWAARRWQFELRWLVLPLFLFLVYFNLHMTQDALTRGPLWYSDYGLGGLQYGAQEVFGEIRSYLAESPKTHIILSPSWANGTNIIARFFYDDPEPFELGSIDGYMDRKLPLDGNTLFIMIPEEYNKTLESGKFTDVTVEKMLPYPNGEPGFYFVRLRYVDNIGEILQQEKDARRILQEAAVTLDGQPATLRYSYLDMGKPDDLFDGNLTSLIRSMEANPLHLELLFNSPRPLQGLRLQIGGTPTDATITLTPADGSAAKVFQQKAGGESAPHSMDFDFGGSINVSQMVIEVHNTNDGEPAHVHLWEVALR